MKTLCIAILLCAALAPLATAKLKESDFNHIGAVVNTSRPSTDQDVSIAGHNCILSDDYASCDVGNYPQTWYLRMDDGYTIPIQFRGYLLTQDVIADPLFVHEKPSGWTSFPIRYRIWCEKHHGRFSVYVGIPVYETGKVKHMALYVAWYPTPHANACPLDPAKVSPEQEAVTRKANACYADGLGFDFKTGQCVNWK